MVITLVRSAVGVEERVETGPFRGASAKVLDQRAAAAQIIGEVGGG